jgi:hypothetical protein
MILIKDLTLESVLHGELKTSDDKIFQISSRSQNVPENKNSAYTTFLSIDGKPVGCIHYNFDDSNKTSSFRGIEIVSDYRGEGLSNAIFETYFQISEVNLTQNFKTKEQRKPLVNFLLSQYGYEPLNNPDSKKVYVISFEKEQLVIGFELESSKKRFLSSNIYKGGQYLVQDTFDSHLGSIQIYKSYFLTDINKFNNKRAENQNKFSINLF